MNIGQAAAASGVSAKMIRYYEATGLLPPAARHANRYRDYGEDDVHRLRFVRRARELGFPVERIGRLLALWSDRSIGNAEVRAVAGAQIAELEAQARRLEALIATLRHLVASCRGRSRAHYPILEDLGGRAHGPARAPADARRRAPAGVRPAA